jgi:hypothetical protein
MRSQPLTIRSRVLNYSRRTRFIVGDRQPSEPLFEGLLLVKQQVLCDSDALINGRRRIGEQEFDDLLIASPTQGV